METLNLKFFREKNTIYLTSLYLKFARIMKFRNVIHLKTE